MSNTRSACTITQAIWLMIKCLIIFQIELEFGNVGFRGEGKTRVPREKPLGARKKTNNQLNPQRQVQDSNVGQTGGRRALSPLRHPCSPLCLFTKIW